MTLSKNSLLKSAYKENAFNKLEFYYVVCKSMNGVKTTCLCVTTQVP